MSTSAAVVIGLALCFAFLNGIHDSSNVVSTIISSRALSMRLALGLTATAEFLGPYLFGVAVARTIGSQIAVTSAVNETMLIAALISAIFWNLITWRLGIPSSSSHSLIGGMVGAVIVGSGWSAIQLGGLEKILIALFTSPILGFLFGYAVLRITFALSWNATPKINNFFRRSQIVTALTLALSNGANDAPKTMGIITLALVIGGYIPGFDVPGWVILTSSLMIALGTALGGLRLIRTLGGKFYRIRPVDGFASQLSSAVVIIGASVVGGPVSTTQVVSSGIMGVGAAERANKVRWGVARDILITWALTIPISALIAIGVYLMLNRYFA